MYIEKRTESSAFFCKRTKPTHVLLRSLQKNVAFFAFFYVLCKRTLRSLRSLRSLTFFAKECCVLCTLFCSLEKNGKERSVFLGLISHQKLEKITERSLKERERTERSEPKRMRYPTLTVNWRKRVHDGHKWPPLVYPALGCP